MGVGPGMFDDVPIVGSLVIFCILVGLAGWGVAELVGRLLDHVSIGWVG